ncbi:MAG: hypothetical protein KHW57_06670 [Clostridium sp.]|nr:hypothetical protein [Clostridium sp.]
MVNFDNVTSNVQSKPRKKTMAESLEEAKQEGKLVVPEEDTQVNAVVSSETVQPKNKARKKKQSKVRKQEEQTTVVNQANEDNDFKDAKTDKLVVPEEDTQVNAVVSSDVSSETVQPKNKARKKKQTTVVNQANEDNDFKDAKTDKRGVPVGINVPQHILDVVCIVKFNAAFRRHTSLNILHTLEDDERICNSKGAYVDFLWNKFRVTADGGLRREYRYTDDLFIDALVKAHADVASDSQRVIGIMIDTEIELHKKNKDSEAS